MWWVVQIKTVHQTPMQRRRPKMAYEIEMNPDGDIVFEEEKESVEKELGGI